MAKCHEEGKCFAKTKSGQCEILKKTIFYDRHCPFMKPEREVTNDVRYPYNPQYIGITRGEKPYVS